MDHSRNGSLSCSLCGTLRHTMHLVQRVRLLPDTPPLIVPDGLELLGEYHVPQLLLCDTHMEDVYDVLVEQAVDVNPVRVEDARVWNLSERKELADSSIGLCEFCGAEVLLGEACYRIASVSGDMAPNGEVMLSEVPGEELHGVACLCCIAEMETQLTNDPDTPSLPDMRIDENGECSLCCHSKCWRNNNPTCHCSCHRQQ